MTHTIEKTVRVAQFRDRLHVKGFKTSDAMHRFLNTGANGVAWRESTKGLKPGIYAFIGGEWRNVKTLDAVALAHC